MSGQIVVAADGRTLGGAARVFDDVGREWHFWVDESGNWNSINSDLTPDTNYYVTTGFLGEGMADEAWDGNSGVVDCNKLTCISKLNPVSFGADAPVENIDF